MIRLLAALLLFSMPAAALELSLPATARLTVERNTDPDIYAAPTGVYAEGAVPLMNVEGAVRRAVWRLESPGLTPLQVMRPLREQLEEAGFDIVLDCPAKTCGGFDFRFAVETLPGPSMYVNIRAYHFVTAQRQVDGAGEEIVTILTSTSASAAYAQIIQAGDANTKAVAVAPSGDVPRVTTPLVPTGDLSEVLLAQGHVVLSGLVFETGSADLGPGPFEALEQVAAFLNAQPSVRVALVGHTDSVGSLSGNIALSKRRAQSVRQRLIEAHGIEAARMQAEGMGYLAPVASNLAETGRDQNRRVEVILLDAN